MKEKIELLKLEDLCTCDYGDTDQVIDYILDLNRKISELIEASNELSCEIIRLHARIADSPPSVKPEPAEDGLEAILDKRGCCGEFEGGCKECDATLKAAIRKWLDERIDKCHEECSHTAETEELIEDIRQALGIKEGI